MKHAGSADLMPLTALLQALRDTGRLVERSPGSFYLKSRALLHFHEHQGALLADVKLDLQQFTRIDVSGPAGQRQLLQALTQLLERTA